MYSTKSMTTRLSFLIDRLRESITVKRSDCMCVFIPALSVSLTPVLLLLGCQPTQQHPPSTPAQHTSENRKPQLKYIVQL